MGCEGKEYDVMINLIDIGGDEDAVGVDAESHFNGEIRYAWRMSSGCIIRGS